MDMVGRLCSPFLVDTYRMKKEIFQPYIIEICAYLATHQKKYVGEYTHFAEFSFIFKGKIACAYRALLNKKKGKKEQKRKRPERKFTKS